MNPINTFQLPPDLFSRNTVIAILAKTLLGDVRGTKVLDVGGHGGELSLFLPSAIHLTIVDKLPKPSDELIEYHQADAKNLPYEDNSFDGVIASDLLEHIPVSDRKQVLQEIVRVSKNFIIVGTPCFSQLTLTTEELIMDHFQKAFGNTHPFLIEHQQMGLPEAQAIEQILQELGVVFAQQKEGYLLSWHLQQLYATLLQQASISAIPPIPKFYELFNHSLDELGILKEPAYRTLWYGKKQGPLPEAAVHETLVHFGWNPATFLSLMEQGFQDISLWFSDTQHELEKVPSLQQKKLELETTIAKARHAVEIYRNTLQDIQKVVHNQDKSLQRLQVQLNQQQSIFLDIKTQYEKLQQQYLVQESEFNSTKSELGESLAQQQWLRERAGTYEKKLMEQSDQLKQKEQLLQTANFELESHQRSLREVMDSRAWKMVMVYTRIKIVCLKPFKLLKKAWKMLWHLGPKIFWQRLLRKLKKNQTLQIGQNAYDLFIQKEQKELHEEKEKAPQIIKGLKYKPLISIVVPVYNVPEEYLVKAIESVQHQWYPRWELCLADDASPQEHIKPLLQRYAAEDPRIKVMYRKENGGIVKATNDALALAKGEYVGFLDNDDELTENALYEVVKALQKERYGFIYSDEDKLSIEGKRCDAFFKPDWSPDLLSSNNYTCHFSVYDSKLVKKVGGLREGYDGSQDYDLVLRVTEKTEDIYHIPKILYHWRKIPGSTAAEVNAKPYVFAAAKKALADSLQRRNIAGEVVDGIWTGSYRTKRTLNHTPLISIIIPFRDKVEILKPCVESILQKSTYKNYELLLVDNQSEWLSTHDYLDSLEKQKDPRIRILRYNHPFNFSAINNFAAREAKGEVLLLLNNDTEVIVPDWLEAMLEHALRPEVGAVGVKLLYPVNLVQHAGVLIGVGGTANHAFLKQTKDDHGYFGQIDVVRNYSAVTGACLMIRKEVYEKFGGLNEKDLAVAFNDVDFCLRLRKKGYLIVYTPYAQLYHYESLSRGYTVNIKEDQYMQHTYADIMENGDPYYNPNLSRERFDFSLRVEDKVQG